MDEWLFSPADPPRLADARAFAIRLIGAATLRAAEVDRWVNRTLQADISLYVRLNQGEIPKVLFGRLMVRGVPFEPEKLFKLLERELKIRPIQP